MYMQGLANFIDDFLGGLMLISYALVVGSVVWSFVILRVNTAERAGDGAILGSVKLLNIGALALAASVATKLVIKAAVLASTLGELPLEAYAGTVQFKAGLLRFFLALGFIGLARQLRREPGRSSSWSAVAGLTVPLVLSGAWLVHAVGRFENRELLMFTTVVHQLAAAVWFGCVAQLLMLWRSSRKDENAKQLWPLAITRFAWLGISSVVLLFCTGIPLAWVYIGSWDGLFGTGYGSLVVTKSWLLLVALGFAYLNNQAGKRWRENGGLSNLTHKVPYYIEAETFILVGILFIAATLSSQPPSIDIQDRTATVAEVVQMFMPNLPRISSPSHEQLLAGEAGRVAVVNKIPSVAAKEWSDYNHNISGIFLTSMGLLALLSYLRHGSLQWARYWPVGFIGLGIFLFFRSDAETWPLGPIGFWESTFGNGEVFQHRIATFMLFILGGMEMRARANPQARQLQYIFPMLCAFGGILLLTHAHAEFELKSEFLIQATHTTMGLLAVIMASGRWLELRLATPAGDLESRIAGIVSMTSMLLIGVIMMFYREPLI
ncbi:MAG: CopD family protein [Methylococcaceae bacterium]|nr:CopD family protein [Methylococcaceae bacterium]